MRGRIILLLWALSIFGFRPLVGQDIPVLSVKLQNASLQEAIQDVEERTGYGFYYKDSWIDSLVISVDVHQQPLTAVLEKIFENTSYHFYIEDTHIFLTKDRKILSHLPPNFFNTTNQPSERSEFDFSDYISKQVVQKEKEEKLYVIGDRSGGLSGQATIAGQVKEAETGEAVIGASVYIENPTIGVATDQFGYFALTIPKGKHTIQIKSIGMKSTFREVMIYGDGRLSIDMAEDITPLKEVVVQSERGVKVAGMQMGAEKLDIKTMKQIPLALGETDILKVMMTLPGVQNGGEGTVGLSVRGGSTNQNMILYNDAIVYNPSHLFGFFSAFNPDVLKNVELLKSGIPAEFGGRLSSVLQVQTREGNASKISGSGGISPITGRFSLEGPIIKDKTTLVVGVRSTYSDWLLDQIDFEGLDNSRGKFYDLTATVNHEFNQNNQIFLSAYQSKDEFSLNSDTVYHYGDRNASVKWKHVFNTRLFSIVTGSLSQYQYAISSEGNPYEAFQMDFAIQQVNGKIDFTYFPKAKHQISSGISVINYRLSPGEIRPIGEASLISYDSIQQEQGWESAIYLGDQYEVTPKLALYGGLRFSLFYHTGPRESYLYREGSPRDVYHVTDTINFAKGDKVATYSGLEPRFSLRYLLPKEASVKLSYNRMIQYIQMLSNTTAVNPTDTWKLSDIHVRPQIGDQISLGLYKNLKNSLFEASLEIYYKRTRNALDYKGGAELLLNSALETDLLEAEGKAYGIELLLKKSAGRLNGWISYTFSRSFLRTKGRHASEILNNGAYYPSNYDVPHSVNFIGNYKFNRRINVSVNSIYSTGRPITLPVAKYEQDGVPRVYYSDRNQFRIPDYFRVDLSVNIEGNHKVKKLAHSSWTVSVYNLLGRANAYSVFFKKGEHDVKGYKLSVFPKPIPTITYSFKF